jgi:hypothetical protein
VVLPSGSRHLRSGHKAICFRVEFTGAVPGGADLHLSLVVSGYLIFGERVNYAP